MISFIKKIERHIFAQIFSIFIDIFIVEWTVGAVELWKIITNMKKKLKILINDIIYIYYLSPRNKLIMVVHIRLLLTCIISLTNLQSTCNNEVGIWLHQHCLHMIYQYVLTSYSTYVKTINVVCIRTLNYNDVNIRGKCYEVFRPK